MLRILSLLAHLPASFLYLWVQPLYFVLFYVTRYRRKTVHDNLARAFPCKSESERARLSKDFYIHLAEVGIEMLLLSNMSADDLHKRVTIVGREHLETLFDAKRSCLLLAAHQANWEWMLAAFNLYGPFPIDAFYRPLHSEDSDLFFKAMRSRFGVEMLSAEGAARTILRKRKQVRAIGLIADQSPRRQDDKLWVNFLNTQTPISPSPDRIARLTQCPVLFVGTERLRRGYYHCTVTPLVSPPYTDNIQISALYMQAIEQQIHRQPAYWMWSHQRWRYRQEECPAPTTPNT
jgi:KDO2-lipid IV(A) lauroyltransferase